MGLVWEQPISEAFGRPEKYILLAYADHADQNGRSIYPSVELICTKTGYEERSVQTITRTLEKLGYLVPDGLGPSGTNRYRIPLVRGDDGGVKIAPLPMQKFAPEGIAPEGSAPEGFAPEPSEEEGVKRLGEIAQALERLTGGLKSTDTDLIHTWAEKHSSAWILKAMEIAAAKKARSANYVDTILIGWEANGYPETRDQKVQGAKRANSQPGRKGAPAEPAPLSDADREAAERINARNAARV